MQLITLIFLSILLMPSVALADDLGCYEPGAVVYSFSQFRASDGSASNATSPACGVFDPDDTTAQTCTAPSQVGSITGLYRTSFTVPGSPLNGVWTVRTTGTVSSVVLVGMDTFEVRDQCPLKPTTAGRKLDVTANGEAGLDFDNTVGTLAKTTDITGFNDLSSAQIATGVWQDTTAGDFTVASSIGKSLYTAGVVPGGANGLFIAGQNAATGITTGLTTTFTGNLTGNVNGSVNSVATAVTLPSIPASWITSAGIQDGTLALAKFNADVKNGGGTHLGVDIEQVLGSAPSAVWNIGKTGYSISGTKTTLDVLNDISTAQVNTEVDTALADVNLDHLVGTATAIPALPANTYLDTILRQAAGTYDRETDSLQAIRDNQGTVDNAAIADAVWDEDIVAAHSTANTAGLIMSQLTKRSGLTFNTEVVDTSILGQMVDDGTATFDRTTDSLQANRDVVPHGTAMRGTDSALLASTTGSGLTAIPWNAAWDAEVEQEVADHMSTQIGSNPAPGSYDDALLKLNNKLPEGKIAQPGDLMGLVANAIDDTKVADTFEAKLGHYATITVDGSKPNNLLNIYMTETGVVTVDSDYGISNGKYLLACGKQLVQITGSVNDPTNGDRFHLSGGFTSIPAGGTICSVVR